MTVEIILIPEASLHGNFAMQGAACEYVPRNPGASVLYGVVADELETFLARQEACDRQIPKFVEDEFRSFLECEILALYTLAVRVVRARPPGPFFLPSTGLVSELWGTTYGRDSRSPRRPRLS